MAPPSPTAVSRTLTRLRIENFRCFRSVDVPLRPLTVLIGANDTGKSVFLSALQRVAQLQRGFSEFDAVGGDLSRQPSISAEVSGESFSGRMQVGPSGKQGSALSTGSYRLPSDGVSMVSTGYSDERGDPPALGPNGEEVPALLDYLLRRDRTRLAALETAVKTYVPGLEHIEIATPQPKLRRVDLRIEGGFRIPADQASTGVRLMLFFVALAYHPSPPRLILIEEPENGVHPRRLEEIIQLMRGITRGDHGDAPAQIVLTTHSPYLLDLIDVREDQVLIFSRRDDGSRTVVPADEEKLKAFLDEFKLGEVWFNEGEAGLGGSPR